MYFGNKRNLANCLKQKLWILLSSIFCVMHMMMKHEPPLRKMLSSISTSCEVVVSLDQCQIKITFAWQILVKIP